MTAAVGADVEAICSKCGDVWHVVVAKVGDKIVKVHCKECNKEHRYKSPAQAKADAARAAAIAAGESPPPKATRAKKAPAPPPEPEGPLVPPDLEKPVKVYRASESFAPGERVKHPTFGEGIAESSPGAGKVTVWFPGGRRVLACAKAESTLARPGPPAANPQKI